MAKPFLKEDINNLSMEGVSSIRLSSLSVRFLPQERLQDFVICAGGIIIIIINIIST